MLDSLIASLLMFYFFNSECAKIILKNNFFELAYYLFKTWKLYYNMNVLNVKNNSNWKIVACAYHFSMFS